MHGIVEGGCRHPRTATHRWGCCDAYGYPAHVTIGRVGRAPDGREGGGSGCKQDNARGNVATAHGHCAACSIASLGSVLWGVTRWHDQAQCSSRMPPCGATVDVVARGIATGWSRSSVPRHSSRAMYTASTSCMLIRCPAPTPPPQRVHSTSYNRDSRLPLSTYFSTSTYSSRYGFSQSASCGSTPSRASTVFQLSRARMRARYALRLG